MNAKQSAVVTACLLWSGLAFAGGFEYPDIGTQAMGRGGAFAAKADDGTAIYYNPAGLADQDDWNVTVDLTMGSQQTSFQRTDPATGANVGPQVSNAPGLFFNPFLSVSRGFKLGPFGKLGVAFGLYSPPADGALDYQDEQPPNLNGAAFPCLIPPAKGNCPGAATSSLNTAPEKYDLINQNILVVYPSISAAWAPIPLISVGGTLQLLVANSQFRQATYDAAALEGMHKISNEQLSYDTIANVNVNGIAFNGNFGLKLRPLPGLSLGASYKPSSNLTQNGTLKLEFSPAAQANQAMAVGAGTSNSTDGTSGSGPASVNNSFPGELKTGIDYDFGLFDVEGDFDWTQWSAYNAAVVTPNFNVNIGGSAQPIPKITIPRGFQDTWSLRLGAEGKIPIPVIRLRARLGVGYESSVYNTSQTQYVSVAYANFGQFWGAVGATVGIGPVDVDATYSHVYMPTQNVANGGLTASLNNAPGVQSFVVNNGTYNTSYDLISVGARVHF